MEKDNLPNKVLIGASGWSYRDWVGPFYPPGTSQLAYLSCYAAKFPVVEVDSTFYAIPRRSTFENWAKRTPEAFRFALKVPRKITHGSETERPDFEKVLLDPQGDLDRFIEAAEPLGEKLGPLVFQFPYFRVKTMPASQLMERLAGALERFPRHLRCAVEIRNKNWITEEYMGLLSRYRAAAVMIDHPYMLPPTQQLHQGMVTTDFAYIRLLGDRYGIERVTQSWDRIVMDQGDRLSEWAEVIRAIQALPDVKTLYAFSNNHYAGHAPATCRELVRRLEDLDAFGPRE